jgi:predicted glycoside hydrolase/deacetylase ChbG (UPF0249 family)
LGVHLTLTSEWADTRWRPLCPPGEVPSLIDQDGYLWSSVGEFTANAKPDQIERELNAQIDAAYAFGLCPTHIDNHMFSLFASQPAFQAYVNVSLRRGLPCLSAKNPSSPLQALLLGTNCALEEIRIASSSWHSEKWLLHYLSQVATIGNGTSQLIVHLGYDEPALRSAIGFASAWGSAWRQRDLDTMRHPEFANLMRQRNIQLLSWRDMAKSEPRASPLECKSHS